MTQRPSHTIGGPEGNTQLPTTTKKLITSQNRKPPGLQETERRKRTGRPLLVAGLCLPKALGPLLPIYLQGMQQVGCARLPATRPGPVLPSMGRSGHEYFGFLPRPLSVTRPSTARTARTKSLSVLVR